MWYILASDYKSSHASWVICCFHNSASLMAAWSIHIMYIDFYDYTTQRFLVDGMMLQGNQWPGNGYADEILRYNICNKCSFLREELLVPTARLMVRLRVMPRLHLFCDIVKTMYFFHKKFWYSIHMLWTVAYSSWYTLGLTTFGFLNWYKCFIHVVFEPFGQKVKSILQMTFS